MKDVRMDKWMKKVKKIHPNLTANEYNAFQVWLKKSFKESDEKRIALIEEKIREKQCS